MQPGAHQLPRTLQPPPDVPALKADAPALTNYLRNFALWCRHGFADKLSITQATPGIMMQAYDTPDGTTPTVFMVQVKTDGTIIANPISIGSGTP